MKRKAAARLLCFTGLLAAVVTVSGQQPTPPDSDSELSALLTSARQLYLSQQFDRSIEAYHALISAAQGKGSELWEARGTLGLGWVANETSRHADARRYAMEALSVFERLNAVGDIGDAN